jgi:hypothetical protein
MILPIYGPLPQSNSALHRRYRRRRVKLDPGRLFSQIPSHVPGLLFKNKGSTAEIKRDDWLWVGHKMSTLNYNLGIFYTDKGSEDELQATAIEIEEFKKQYDTMTREEKSRLPPWLGAQLEKT